MNKKISIILAAFFILFSITATNATAADTYKSMKGIAKNFARQLANSKPLQQVTFEKNIENTEENKRKELKKFFKNFFKYNEMYTTLKDKGRGKMLEYKNLNINKATVYMNSHTDYLSNTTFSCRMEPKTFMTESESKALKKIAKKAGRRMKGETKYDTIKNVYAFVIRRLEYGKDKRNTYQSYKKRSGNCITYSMLMYLTCRNTGIPCKIMSSKDHVWNIVKFENKWYLCDATWDDTNNAPSWNYFMRGTDDFKSYAKAKSFFKRTAYQKKFPIAKERYIDEQYPENNGDRESSWFDELLSFIF